MCGRLLTGDAVMRNWCASWHFHPQTTFYTQKNSHLSFCEFYEPVFNVWLKWASLHPTSKIGHHCNGIFLSHINVNYWVSACNTSFFQPSPLYHNIAAWRKALCISFYIAKTTSLQFILTLLYLFRPGPGLRLCLSICLSFCLCVSHLLCQSLPHCLSSSL